MLLRQEILRAFSLAWAKTGNRIAARMAIMAMTTSSSMRVKPRCFIRILQEVRNRAGAAYRQEAVIGPRITPTGVGRHAACIWMQNKMQNASGLSGSAGSGLVTTSRFH